MNQYENRYFQVTLCDGKDYMFDTKHKCIVRAVENASEEDFKTAIAKHIPDIPKGTEVEISGCFENCYGRFLEVQYNGRIYSVNPRYFEYVKIERK